MKRMPQVTVIWSKNNERLSKWEKLRDRHKEKTAKPALPGDAGSQRSLPGIRCPRAMFS